VGLPAIRGAKSTTDMSYLDELYRARADKAGIAYVDIWDGLSTIWGAMSRTGQISKGKRAACALMTGCIFPRPARRSLGTMSSTICAGY
jgi:hypothetical protein